LIAGAGVPSIDRAVVIAVSGRALAQSAAKCARDVTVLDAFGDADTRAVARTLPVGLRNGIGLDGARMMAALGSLARSHDTIIVTGSGFERAPRWLDRVARFGTLCANDATMVAGLKDPAIGLELLAALGWRVPETSRCRPAVDTGWLSKRIGGAGGVHVQSAAGIRESAGRYWQREIAGIPMSVTFLADGQQAHVLGFNRLFVAAIGKLPFCHAGARSGAALPEGTTRDMQVRLDRLVRVCALHGLNGLDFVLSDHEPVVLEVNPRPTATFELYDDDFARGLVHWHVRSFDGPIADFPSRQPTSVVRALQIVYAERALAVPPGSSLPPWCRDVPWPGSHIPAGAPVLTVSASGITPEAAQRELDARIAEIGRQLALWSAQCGPISGNALQ